MSREDTQFKKYATEYDPIKIGSIDGDNAAKVSCTVTHKDTLYSYSGTDTEPHDRAILRALHSEYNPSKLAQSNPDHTLFVGRLNPRTTEDTVKSDFAEFGKIVSCRLVRDIVTGKSKQYAFVEYDNMSSLERALRSMQREYIDGSEVIVEREAGRRLVGWRPRRLGGGFGGRKESGQLRFGCQDRPFKKPFIVAPKQERDINR